MGRQSKRHELTVENDEEETLVKVDDAEVVGDPRRFLVTKQDIEKVGYSDGCRVAMLCARASRRRALIVGAIFVLELLELL